jgi:hypothetical protein
VQELKVCFNIVQIKYAYVYQLNIMLLHFWWKVFNCNVPNLTQQNIVDTVVMIIIPGYLRSLSIDCKN